MEVKRCNRKKEEKGKRFTIIATNTIRLGGHMKSGDALGDAAIFVRSRDNESHHDAWQSHLYYSLCTHEHNGNP